MLQCSPGDARSGERFITHFNLALSLAQYSLDSLTAVYLVQQFYVSIGKMISLSHQIFPTGDLGIHCLRLASSHRIPWVIVYNSLVVVRYTIGVNLVLSLVYMRYSFVHLAAAISLHTS